MPGLEDAMNAQRQQAATQRAEAEAREAENRRHFAEFVALMKSRRVPSRTCYTESKQNTTEGLFKKRDYIDYTYTYVGECWVVDETDLTYQLVTESGDYVSAYNINDRPKRQSGNIRWLYPPQMEQSFRAGHNVYVLRPKDKRPYDGWPEETASHLAYVARVHFGELGPHYFRA